MSAQESQHYELIDRLAEEFAARYRDGQHPSLQEYIDRYPELADDIRELLPALAEVEQVKQDFRAPPMPVPPESPPPLQQLGDYRILREVGKGGMGIVYEAEQISLGRRVALKVLPKSMLLEAKAKRRFEREARAAAKLHHTNIVPVFGVGEHDGLPYYVMQFIHGLGLDDVLEELKRMQGTAGSKMTTPPEGALRVSRKELSAGNIARSLVTGAFAATADMAPADFPVSGSADSAERPVAITAPSAGHIQPVSGAASASPANARRSDSFTLSPASLTLPGRSGDRHRSKAGKATYWESVAHIGVQVADALEYAHHQGILHRDIKPSNLLLDTAGTVWVADFGLAKTDDRENITHSGDILGTLRYMPPEAFDGHADPRSDIYALGLTLYELLALEPAFSAKDRNNMIRQVMDAEPTRLDRLNPAIPRDLVTVVHKAMDRDPAQRYQTAAELAVDLQRFIDDEPIQARRLSRRERLWRWCRRHPGVAGLSAALVLLLVGVSVVSVIAAYHFDRLARDEAAAAVSEREARLEEQKAKLQEIELRGRAEKSESIAQANLEEADKQRRQAEANFAQARAAVDDYFTKISQDNLLDAPGMQPLRRELLQSALKFYEGFVRQRHDDPGLRAELAAAYLRLGRVHAELEETERAKDAFRNGRRLYAALLENEPKSAAWRDGLAECWFGLHNFTKAIDIWKGLVEPGKPRFHKELADAYNGRARTHFRANRAVEALVDDQAALAIREQVVRMRPNDPDAHRDLGQSLNNIGVAVARRGRVEEALSLYRRAAEHAEIAASLAPRVIVYRFALANFLFNRAAAEFKLGHTQTAVATMQSVVAMRAKLARDNPAVPKHQSKLIQAYAQLASCYRQRGEHEQAKAALARAREAIERLPDDTPEALFLIGCARAEYAKAFAKKVEAKATYIPSKEEQQQANLAMAALQKAVASGFRHLAQWQTAREFTALRRRDDFRALEQELAAIVAASPDEKLKAGEQALSLRRKLAEHDPKNLRVRADLAASQHAIGLIDRDVGKLEEAGRALTQALKVREGLVAEAPQEVAFRADLADSALSLGQVHWLSGRLADGAAAWAKAQEQLQAALRLSPDDAVLARKRINLLLVMGQTHARAGLWHEAAGAYRDWMQASRSRPVGNDQITLLQAASVQAAAGDAAAYRKTCAEFADRWGEAADGMAVLRLAEASCLLPSSSEVSRCALNWAQKGAASTESARSRFVLALAHYRSGEFKAVLAAAEDSPNNEAWGRGILNLPLLAMAHHRLGHNAAAKRLLAKAEAEWRRLSPLSANVTAPLVVPAAPWYANWHHWVEFELLYREASTLITGSPPLAQAFEQMHEGFICCKLGGEKKGLALLEMPVKTWPADPDIRLARSNVFTLLGKEAEADADVAAALKLRSATAASWIHAGQFFEDADRPARAAQAYKKAAELSADELHHFIDAGWWVAGVHGDQFRLPPDNQSDPHRLAVGLKTGAGQHWRRVRPAPDGRVDLGAIFMSNDISVDAVTQVHAPEERTATLLVGGDDSLWIWVNGRLVYKQSRFIDWQPRALDVVPITLRAGRNTILCRINQTFGAHYFYLRFADSPFDRASDDPERQTEAEQLRAWLKNQDKATAGYDLAVKLRSDDPEPLLARAARLDELKRPKEADADFARAVALRPADKPFWRQQARDAAALGRWRLALACYKQYGPAVLDDAGWAGYEQAAVSLLAGDQEGYRRICTRYLDSRRDIQPPFGFLAVRACILGPDAVSDPQLLDNAAVAELKDKNAYFLLTTSAAVDYRLGRFQKAADTLRRCMAENPTWDGNVLNWLLLALTCDRLGQKDEARAWLDKACGWLDRHAKGLPLQPEGSVGLHLHDWLQAQILRREAEAITRPAGAGRP